MICLGIESTAHTFGCGIVTEKGKVLANEKHSYSSKTGGIHPTEAKEHHLKFADEVIKKALKKSKKDLKDIDLIAFSQGPGLPPCLVVGMEKAKKLARKKPLVGVNHCIAHLEIGRLLTKAKDPVMLYVSGANTQVIAFEGEKYRIFGETLDMGCGNFLDSFARLLGIGFPGGPVVAKLAEKGKEFIKLPYSVKGMDVSFSGLFTNVKNKIKHCKKQDLAFSIQETVFAMLVETAERAMAHCNKDELLLGGGVCCNKRLQEMCHIMCKERGAKLFVPKTEFLVDNAAMIAWLGLIMHKAKVKTVLDIKPNQRTDHVNVKWC